MTNPKAFRALSTAFFITLALGAGACKGCNNDTGGPVPVPADTAAPPPPPNTIAPIVEPPPSASNEAGAGGAPRVGPAPSSLKACCAALRGNASSMPPPNNAYALAAAAYCDSAVASGQDRNAIVQGVRQALKGASVPTACK